MEELADLLKLGLLFGQDVDITTEGLPEILTFQHKLIQEYMAAIFVAKQIKADAAFLSKTFPTWKIIETHCEVLRFASGLLAEHDAGPMANHIANILVKDTHYELGFPTDFPPTIMQESTQEIIESCNVEGHLPAFNPNLCVYPSCGHHLADAIKHSRFVLLNGVNEHDPLQLQASSVPVILNIMKDNCGGKQREVNRLMNALTSSHINVQAIDTDIEWDDMCEIHTLTQLKYIAFRGKMAEKHVKDLTDSINSSQSEPQLRAVVSTLPVISDQHKATAI